MRVKLTTPPNIEGPARPMAERVKCTFTWFYSNFIGKKPSWILSRTPLNEGYPGMTLNMKKSFPKNRKKDPKHHLIWYFAYFYRYRHQYLSTYPKKFGQTIFFKVWLQNILTTNDLEIYFQTKFSFLKESPYLIVCTSKFHYKSMNAWMIFTWIITQNEVMQKCQNCQKPLQKVPNCVEPG